MVADGGYKALEVINPEKKVNQSQDRRIPIAIPDFQGWDPAVSRF
jgi:hypothetical protein